MLCWELNNKIRSFCINRLVLIAFIFVQVHVQENSSGEWFLLGSVPVKHLSSQPDIGESALGLLGHLRGSFGVRVLARIETFLGLERLQRFPSI